MQGLIELHFHDLPFYGGIYQRFSFSGEEKGLYCVSLTMLDERVKCEWYTERDGKEG